MLNSIKLKPSTIANLADDFVEFFNNQYEVLCKALDRGFKYDNLY